MIVRYVDLATGRRAEDCGITPHSLMDGNWNCDCNRRIPFDNPPPHTPHSNTTSSQYACEGHIRFIVYDVKQEEGDPEPSLDSDEIIKEANERYYQQLCCNE